MAHKALRRRWRALVGVDSRQQSSRRKCTVRKMPDSELPQQARSPEIMEQSVSTRHRRFPSRDSITGSQSS